MQELTATVGVSKDALAAEVRTRFNTTWSKLTDEDRAEIILWLREMKALAEQQVSV
mgnify:CR=1 FL=1